MADVFGIDAGSVDESLRFQGISEWDSLGHAELMVALEDALNCTIDERRTLELTTYPAIARFVLDPASTVDATPTSSHSRRPLVNRGLQGIVMDRTTVSKVDGRNCRLLYRGYPIDELARSATYEETAYLLLHGELPTAGELSEFDAELRAQRTPTAQALALVESMSQASPAVALRTAVSILPDLRPDVRSGASLVACVPTLIAAHHAARSGNERPRPNPELSHAHNLLVMLGVEASEETASVLDQAMLLQAEHGSGASTLTIRNVIGTGADLSAAVTAALATFVGPNHGGAIERVVEVVTEVGAPENASEYVRRARAARAPVAGFGHRVYRGADPRARWLRELAEQLSAGAGDRSQLEILDALRTAMSPLSRHGIDVNVDFYAGLVYFLLGIPGDLSVAVFAAARTPGWVAHAAEQYERNILIRPQLEYVGQERTWKPSADRATSRNEGYRYQRRPFAAQGLLAGFLRSAQAAPSDPALVIGGLELTYSEVEQRARSWGAAALDAADGRPGPIAFLGSRSEISYIAPLAALFTGRPFVPLNPRFPIARTRQMIERSRPAALIADDGALAQARTLTQGVDGRPPVVDSRVVDARSSIAPGPVNPEDVAYQLFTSGSSGEPKGVPITHRNVAAFLDHNVRRYGLGPGDRLSQTFDQTFDLSIFDLFGAWWSGACVCALDRRDLLAPAVAVERLGITVWFSVPSLVGLLRRRGLLRPGSMPSLRWSLFCGEPLSQANAEAWQAAAPNSTVENLYGPTELTIACAAYRWDPDSSPADCRAGRVPIGHVYEGLHHVLLDPDSQPTEGQEGELAVAGAQTFGGYAGRGNGDDSLFEMRGEDGVVRSFYRTGDRVVRRTDGGLDFLGRSDDQIQIMGYRVELGEVEAALCSQPGVAEALVVPIHGADGVIEGLSAAVTGSGLDGAKIADSARAVLPEHAIPQRVTVLDELPLNANGKLDRAELGRRLTGGARA